MVNKMRATQGINGEVEWKEVNEIRGNQWDDDVERMNVEPEKENMRSIIEIYSPPRVNTVAGELGLIPGMSLGLQ